MKVSVLLNLCWIAVDVFFLCSVQVSIRERALRKIPLPFTKSFVQKCNSLGTPCANPGLNAANTPILRSQLRVITTAEYHTELVKSKVVQNVVNLSRPQISQKPSLVKLVQLFTMSVHDHF